MTRKTVLSEREQAPTWLTVAQVAQAIGMTPQGVYGLIRRHDLPAYRFGGAYRITTEAFRAFVERSRLAAPEDAAGSAPVNGKMPVNDIDVQASVSFIEDCARGEYTAFDLPAKPELHRAADDGYAGAAHADAPLTGADVPVEAF